MKAKYQKPELDIIILKSGDIMFESRPAVGSDDGEPLGGDIPLF